MATKKAASASVRGTTTAREPKRVDEKQLAVLVKPLVKEGASATGVLKALRGKHISVAGKRVRSMFKQLNRAPKTSKRQVA